MNKYYQCSNCNYRFMTQNDSYCRKCGIENPLYTEKNEVGQDILDLISKINDNINSCVNELSLKMEKIEEQIRLNTT